MNENDASLDYERMIVNLKNMLSDTFEMQNRYFELARRLKEFDPYIKVFGEKMFDCSMSEQIAVMEMSVKIAELQKCIIERHGWDEEIEPVNLD